MFQIGTRVFLVVANGQRLHDNGSSEYAINSTIYELDMTGRVFVRFQDIVTYRYHEKWLKYSHSVLTLYRYMYVCKKKKKSTDSEMYKSF